MPLPHRPRAGKSRNGLPVYDAVHDQAIKVLEKHVNGACPRSMCDCAIARAARDMGFADAEISPHRAWLREHGCDYWLRFVNHWPEKVIIRLFDHDGGFPKDLIALYAPSASHRIGHPAPKTKRGKNKKKMSKRRIISLRNHPKRDAEIPQPTRKARDRILKAMERHMDRQP